MPSKRRAGGSSLSGLIPTTSYHSAHKPALDGLPSLDEWQGNGVTALTHDIVTGGGLPPEFKPCDVLVADLPWQKGFETFNERAGVDDGRTYAQFMAAVSEIVEAATVPTYLITGKHALPKLPTPATTLPMMLNEDEAIAIAYRPGVEVSGKYGVAPEFLHALTQRYDIAGDFCCGYGRTARVFLRAGKRAVVSDFNPQCIGYIAQHAAEWAPA